jgi:hypothetical protein
MGKRIALIFAAAVAIGTGPAIAADLLPPPPPIEVPPVDFSGCICAAMSASAGRN